jgi:hypothetical protein
MKKQVFTILTILIVLSCTNEPKSTKEETIQPIVEINSKQEALINELTLNDSFKLDDVRRYGIFPNQGDSAFPSVISKVKLKGNETVVRKAEATNIEISNIDAKR